MVKTAFESCYQPPAHPGPCTRTQASLPNRAGSGVGDVIHEHSIAPCDSPAIKMQLLRFRNYTFLKIYLFTF